MSDSFQQALAETIPALQKIQEAWAHRRRLRPSYC